MEFNYLEARATSRRQFTFYHQVPRNFCYSFYGPRMKRWKAETMKDWVDLGATSGFEHGTPGLGI